MFLTHTLYQLYAMKSFLVRRTIFYELALRQILKNIKNKLKPWLTKTVKFL